MLNIISYVMSLLPHIEKKDVLEDLRITASELGSVRKAFSDAALFYAKDKFSSKANVDINNRVMGIIKVSAGGRFPTFLNEFSLRLDKLETNVETLVKAIDKEIGRSIVTEGVSSKRVMLLRIAEKCSYISRYSLDLLNLIYQNEASELMKKSDAISMSPAEINKAKASVDNLSYLLLSYGIDNKEFQKMIDSTPDIILSRDNNLDIEASWTDKDLDPMTSTLLVGFNGSPIYHIRMSFAEWQTSRYKANQEKKKVIELRLLHLRLLQETKGDSNPKIEEEINYIQNRVGKLDRYLTEVEEDLDIAA